MTELTFVLTRETAREAFVLAQAWEGQARGAMDPGDLILALVLDRRIRQPARHRSVD